MNNSIDNVERFRQIKSSIRMNPNYLIIGADVSKKSSIGCFYNSIHGILAPKYRIMHMAEGFRQLSEKIEQLRNQYQFQEVIIGVEPTGNYHKVLCEYMKSLDYNVVYVSSVAAKNNKKTMAAGRWSKSDPRDAYNIVDLMRQGKILFYRGEDGEHVDLRNYIAVRRRLITAKSALQSRIRNFLWACYFPELDDIFSKTDDPDVLTLLEHCPSAETIRAMSQRSFLMLFPPTIRAQRYSRINSVWQCAFHSVGYAAPPSVICEAKMLARDITRIQQDILVVDKQLATYCPPSDVYHQLLTMPGFGPFNTAVFKAVVGDINRFNHPQQLVKLAGLDLELMESGAFRGRAKISKKGSALFRYALSSAANVALSKHKQIRQIFLEKLNALGNTKSAKAKLKIKFIEKFIRIAFHLLKHNVPFSIHHFTVPVREPVHVNVRA